MPPEMGKTGSLKVQASRPESHGYPNPCLKLPHPPPSSREHLLAAPVLHPFPSSLSPQSYALSHPPSLFLRVLVGPDSADVFALHPVPRLDGGGWGTACRWRQAGQPPSWFLLNLCWLIFPVPVTRSQAYQRVLGKLPLPSSTVFAFEKGEVEPPQGLWTGLTAPLWFSVPLQPSRP